MAKNIEISKESYLKDKSYRRKLTFFLTILTIAFTNYGFYTQFVYPKDFPDLHREQTFKEIFIHTNEQYYQWVINITDLPTNVIYAHLIFSAFWTFFIFLCLMEGYYLREQWWKNRLSPEDYNNK